MSNIPATLEKLVVPVSGLVHYGKNPRRGDVDAIADSLKSNGQYKPIVVRAGTNEVLAGNHTLKAAKLLGWQEIAATFIDVDDDAAARIVLVDNRTNDLATYDTPELRELLESLPDLAGTGYDVVALADLYEVQEPAEAPEDVDDVPEAPKDPRSRKGDLWFLGEHRVLCGDATEPADYHELMAGDVAELFWTDPPYGVEYVGKTKDALRIENDGSAGLAALLHDSFRAAVQHLRPGAPCYVAHADTERATFEREFRGAGFLFRQNLVWVKNTMVLGRSDYHYKHEPILEGEAPEAEVAGRTHTPVLYGFTAGAEGRLGRGGPRWFGADNATTVFDFPKPPASREHPTMKPVALVLAMMANSLRPGRIVLDPFGGSGSTLIAADLHGAYARLLELDPRYVDVICARYQRATGELPRRGDGTPVDFLTEA
jgi:DNA modification methylase